MKEVHAAGEDGKRNQVHLDGEWDLTRREELSELLGRLSVDGHATIDLRGCTYADSTILSALAELGAKFANKEVVLLSPPPQLQKLLKITAFDRLFRIVDGE